MNRAVAAACVAVLVISLKSKQCNSLEYYLDNPVNNNVDSEKDLLTFKRNNYFELITEKPQYATKVGNDLKEEYVRLFFANLFGSKNDVDKNDIEEVSFGTKDGPINRRAVRQAYQTPLYPNLPGPPYSQGPYTNYNNPIPGYNPLHQNSYNNNSQTGYPFYNNGIKPSYNSSYGPISPFPYNHTQPGYAGYRPSNFSNPMSPYGQPQPNPWQPHRNPYGSNGNPPYDINPYPGLTVIHISPNTTSTYNYTSLRPPYHHPGPYKNNTYQGYPPHTPGQIPVNSSSHFSYNPNFKNPLGNSQTGYPFYNNGIKPSYNGSFGPISPFPYNHTQPGYAGYRPSNFSNPMSPYGQPQPNPWQPNSNPQNSTGNNPAYNTTPYPGLIHISPNTTPTNNYYQAGQNNPSQKPQYYPGQSQHNSTYRPGYPQVVPGNQHPVVYEDSTKRPGQNPYNSYNISKWLGNTLNNTYSSGRPPYNGPPYNPYNSYPNSPGFGSPNTTYSYNGPNQQTNQSPPSSQFPSSGYPGHSQSSSDPFNLAHGYNPSIPNRPPYGNGPPSNIFYPQGRNGTAGYDPASLQNLSYPH